MGEGAPVDRAWVGTPCHFFTRLSACLGEDGRMPCRGVTCQHERSLLTGRKGAAWLIPLAGLVVVEPFVGSTGFLAAWWTRATGLALALGTVRLGRRWIALRYRKESRS